MFVISGARLKGLTLGYINTFLLIYAIITQPTLYCRAIKLHLPPLLDIYWIIPYPQVPIISPCCRFTSKVITRSISQSRKLCYILNWNKNCASKSSFTHQLFSLIDLEQEKLILTVSTLIVYSKFVSFPPLCIATGHNPRLEILMS